MWERVQETTPWSEGKVSVGKISPSRYVRLPARAGGGGGVGGGAGGSSGSSRRRVRETFRARGVRGLVRDLSIYLSYLSIYR